MNLTADEFFLAFGTLLTGRRAALKRRVTMAFAVVDAGGYSIDTRAEKVVSRGIDRTADVSIVCNQKTLSDLLTGRFDPDHPAGDQLFVWRGDGAALEAIELALSGAKSWLDVRAGR